MFHNLKYAMIADIGAYELTFYDEDNQAELEHFCRRNLISYLPGRDRQSIYQMTDRGFIQANPAELVQFNPDDRIFDKDVLAKFEALHYNNVGLITENGVIKGVVHIVDYKCEYISVEFYRALYKFDENLRKLLLNNLFTNDDFIQWMKGKKDEEEGEGYWTERYHSLMPEDKDLRRRMEQNRMNAKAFFDFYLADILAYIIDLGLLERKRVNIEEIKGFRNSIIQSMDTSDAQEVQEDEVYSFNNLKAFVIRARSFFEAYEYLEDEVLSS